MLRCPRPRPRGLYFAPRSPVGAPAPTRSSHKLAPRRAKNLFNKIKKHFHIKTNLNITCMSCQMLQDVFGCFALLSFCIDFEKAMLRQGGAGLAAEERGVAKPRGRGRGRRNIFKIVLFLQIKNLFQTGFE